MIILAVSLFVVRLGGTALRVTGMPKDAARFQSISALTGTGFTTQEAESTMHHPLRRKVLIGLMFAGHLGVVSLASTVILGVSRAQDGAAGWTVLYLVIAVMIVCALALSHTLDRIVCGIIETVFNRLGWFNSARYLVLAELPDGMQLAEHTVMRPCMVNVEDTQLHFLSPIHSAPQQAELHLAEGENILCYGSAEHHNNLSASLGYER